MHTNNTNNQNNNDKTEKKSGGYKVAVDHEFNDLIKNMMQDSNKPPSTKIHNALYKYCGELIRYVNDESNKNTLER